MSRVSIATVFEPVLRVQQNIIASNSFLVPSEELISSAKELSKINWRYFIFFEIARYFFHVLKIHEKSSQEHNIMQVSFYRYDPGIIYVWSTIHEFIINTYYRHSFVSDSV